MIYNTKRRKSNTVRVGDVFIGGEAAVSIQSMTNTDTHDIDATLAQVKALEEAGCDIVRLAIPDIAAAKTLYVLKERGIRVPLVADVHFDYKIAIEAAREGADKIRINPGNIGSDDKVEAVVRACTDRGLPIRIGVNSGSRPKSVLEKYKTPTAEALAESALYHASLLEKFGFSDILLSVKASNTREMIEANRILAGAVDYPLHLGVTEAGGGMSSVIKSSVGIGALLSEGIGDTIRVSMTDDPVREVEVARGILKSLGLYNGGMDIVSCPTCGRTKIDLISLLARFEARAREEGIDKKSIKVALMGCAVNGPGEAREADIGIAGGVGEGLIFKRGEIIKKVKEDELIDELIREIKKM